MEKTSQRCINLLIVEDNVSLSTCLLEYFQSTEYTTTTVGDADTAMRYLTQPRGYDLVLLDLSLPGKSGFELLEEVQGLSIDPSFILLTVLDQLESKLRAFSLGADDYLIKPCACQELKARMDAVLRRRQAPVADDEEQSYAFRDLTIDFVSNTCFRDGQRIPLTALEFEILEYLVERKGRVVPREELRNTVWAERETICLRTIDRHVAKIREKIEQDPDVPAYLQTVYGKGYEFVAAEYA